MSHLPNLALLRSQLIQVCPSLKNLTIVDLEECKWTTRRNIFKNLIESNNKLIEFSNKIEDTIARRNSEVSLQKQKSAARDVVVEYEQIYRSTFMQIVFDVLCFAGWPPVQEAFTDHLNLLMIDNSFNLRAMAYLATCCGSEGYTPFVLSEVPTSKKVDKKQSVVNNATVKSSPRLDEADVLIKPAVTPKKTGEVRLSQPACQYKDAQMTIELLQSQNEILRERLSVLELAINMRMDCESSLERVLADVIEMVQSLCLENDLTKPNILSNLTMDYTTLSDAPQKKTGSVLNASAVSNGNNSKGASWKNVAARLLKLQSQWSDIKATGKQQSSRSNNVICPSCGNENIFEALPLSTLFKDALDLSIQSHKVINSLYADNSAHYLEGESKSTEQVDFRTEEFERIGISSLVKHNILTDYADDSNVLRLQTEMNKLAQAIDKHLADVSPLIPLATCSMSFRSGQPNSLNTPAMVRLVDEVCGYILINIYL